MRINVASRYTRPARPGSQQLGRACLLLGRLDEARRLGDRAQNPLRVSPGSQTAAKVYERTANESWHTST